jgi:hypothetical protein
MTRAVIAILLLLSTCAVVPAATPSKPIFIFHTDEFWLNLHHFLYVLGRAQNKTSDASREAVIGAPADQEKGFAALSASERNVWNEAVSAYASGNSKKDLIFDEPLTQLTKALAHAGDAPSLDTAGIDSTTLAILQRAAPIYRKAWWPKHQKANRAWVTAMQPYVDKDGPTVLSFITRAYQFTWPEAGYAVHLSAFSNWAGAFSTGVGVLVISSLTEGNRGPYGLETLFHESMHQWDSQVFDALRTQARANNKLVPRGLSHALIFFTAGEAVRRVIPGHVPYAEKFGVWQRGMMQFKTPIEQTWKPYLDGKGTRDEAFAELIKLTGESKP